MKRDWWKESKLEFLPGYLCTIEHNTYLHAYGTGIRVYFRRGADIMIADKYFGVREYGDLDGAAVEALHWRRNYLKELQRESHRGIISITRPLRGRTQIRRNKIRTSQRKYSRRARTG